MGTVMATQKKKAKAQRVVQEDQFQFMNIILAEDVARTGEEIVIEYLGVPLAKLVPLEGEAGEAARELANQPKKPKRDPPRDLIWYYGDLDKHDDTDMTLHYGAEGKQ